MGKHTVTGLSTGWTLLSSNCNSITAAHKNLIPRSDMHSPDCNVSMYLSTSFGIFELLSIYGVVSRMYEFFLEAWKKLEKLDRRTYHKKIVFLS